MKKLTLLIFLIYLAGCNDGSGQKDWTFPSPTPFSPFIQLSAAELAFTGAGCGSNPASQTFEVTNAGKGTFTWSTSNVPSWLMLTPSGGTVPTTVTAQIDTTGLSCGEDYSQTVHIEAPDAGNTPVSLTVTLTIPAPTTPPPAIITDTPKVTFTASSCGGIATSGSPSFTITSDGNGSFHWSATASQPWIQFAPTNGTDGATVTVADIDTATLPCGATSSGTITISSTATGVSPQSVTVEVIVPPRPAIITDKLKVTFTASSCGGVATSGSPSFMITSDGNGGFSWSGAGSAAWIQFAPTSGTDGATVTVANVDTADLPCGATSSGTITLTSAEAGNSPQSVTVEVVVPSAANITPSASALGFFATACKGSPDPQPFTIQNNGGSSLGWSAAVTYAGAETGWVTLDITGGTVAAGATSTDITVTVDASTLTCGQAHSATLTLTATSGGSALSPVQSKTIEVGLSNPVAWKHQNPKPTSYPINDVTFSEEGVAWAVADSGTILRSPPDSPDYGNNWIPVVSGTGEDLRAIRFVNPLEGWIVGDGGTILHSSNGGAIWETESSSTTQPLQSVYFLDASHGWAVGDAGTILYRDGGGSWAPIASGRTDQLTHVFMNDATHGWITTNNANDSILWTDDNWAGILPQDRKSARQLYSLFFLPKDPNSPFPDRLEGWAVGAPDLGGNGSILHIYSDTGAEPWTTEMVASGTTSTLLDVFMSTPSLGWAIGGDDNTGAGTILQWNGAAWLPVTFNAGDPSLPSAKYFRGVASNNGNGVAAGLSGMVFTSFNGTAWDNVSGPSMNHLKSVGFALDGVNGWAVGDAGTVLTTSTGGSSWIKQSAGASDFNSLSVVSATDAWAVTSNRQIYHYSSGAWGLNTTLTSSGSLKGVHFANATNGWAVGRVVNGATTRQVYYYNGTTWSPQASACIPAAATMNGIYFLDASRGWMVGTSGWTARTTDGGASWACTQATPTTTTWNAVHFISASTGWAVGNSGRIYRTTDGGVTWSPQTSTTTSALFAVRFSDANNGWVVGAAGMVLYTQNGGSTWTRQSQVGTNQNLNGLYFAPGGLEGWAVGNNGVLLHTGSGGVN
ncbi:MAG: YCF48-related protein [Candidatus Manganitrophus sp. SB1]|nr:YCF48-related protein [Candidatus Manganitrophus morganii]